MATTKRAIRKEPETTQATKSKLQHTPWASAELENLDPLLQRQFVVGNKIMLARVLLKTGCIVPLHHHHNEQVSYVVNGAFEILDRRPRDRG